MFKVSSKERKCKTSLKFHLAPVGMTRIKRTTKIKCWRGCGEKGTLFMRHDSGSANMSNYFVNQSGNYTCFLKNVI